MKLDNNRRVVLYEVYERRDGQKVGRLVSSRSMAKDRKRWIRRNKRKFLGYRKVVLAEVKS